MLRLPVFAVDKLYTAWYTVLGEYMKVYNFKVGDKVIHYLNPDIYGIGTVLKVYDNSVDVIWEKCPDYGVCRDPFYTKRKLTKLELALK